MSAKVLYDPTLFVLQRKVGASWVALDYAAFHYSYSYSPDELGTLLPDSEAANVALTRWDTPAYRAGDPLETTLDVGETVRARYNARPIGADSDGLFIVDSVNLTYAVDPDAARHGARRRIDFTANMVGLYAALMVKVPHTVLPAESPIKRIRRVGVTVSGY